MGTDTVELEVVHRTRYVHLDAASTSHHLLHLTPRDGPWQRTRAHHIDVAPVPDESIDRHDWFGNPMRIVVLNQPHADFRVEARSRLHLSPRPPLGELDRSPSWEATAAALGSPRVDAAPLEARQYLYDSPHVLRGASLAAFARASFPGGRGVVQGAAALMHRLNDEFTFDPKATDLSTPIDEVLRLRRGVCQDFAHLMIGCLRSLGLAARYVSGYVQTWRGDERDRPMVGADASHAWVSVWCPTHGWIDVDPTNDCLVDREHVTLAWGRDFSDVTPVRGVVLGSMQPDPEVAVTVRRIVR
ncbi:MAG: transglutaminase domain-containing protein [Lautropia sp.]